MQDFIQKECQVISDYFLELKQQAQPLSRAVEMCQNALKQGHKIMFCGNGGSASQAQHLAAELVGRYKLNRSAMASIALTTDTSILTAVGNDYGFDEIFARQVEGLGKEGDILIGLSTSGNSMNVLKAFDLAKEKNITTIAFVGAQGGKMAEKASLSICVPSRETNHIQEMHLALGHMLCGLIEENLYHE